MFRKRLMTENNLSFIQIRKNKNYFCYSEDLSAIVVKSLENRYGGKKQAQSAAKLIQRSYRMYKIRQRLMWTDGDKRCTNRSLPDKLDNLDDAYDSPCSSSTSEEDGFAALSKNLKDSLSMLVSLNARKKSRIGSESTNSDSECSESCWHNKSLTCVTSPLQNCEELKKTKKKCRRKSIQIGDRLSTKCEEELEKFECRVSNDDDDDDERSSICSSSSSLSKGNHDNSSNNSLALPPPMPVIATNKSNLITTTPTNPCSNNQPTRSSNPSNNFISSIKSPRDSGVSSHSSNMDLLNPQGINDSNPDTPQSSQVFKLTPLSSSTNESPQKARSSIASDNSSLAASNLGTNISMTSSQNKMNDNFSITTNSHSNNIPINNTIPPIMTSSRDSGVIETASSSSPSSSTVLNASSSSSSCRSTKMPVCSCSLVTMVNRQKVMVALHPVCQNNNIRDASVSLCASGGVQSITSSTFAGLQQIRSEETREFMRGVLQRVAINLFNRNMHVGLLFLNQHNFLTLTSVRDIAHFLYNSRNHIHPQLLTEFLLTHHVVLQYFLEILPLSTLDYLEAVDIFLSIIHIPSEVSKLQSLLSQFNEYFCTKNNCVQQKSVLEKIGRIIALVKLGSQKNNIPLLSFAQFVKKMNGSFKGSNKTSYSMDHLQKSYINLTSTKLPNNRAEFTELLVNRIDNFPSSNNTVPKSYFQTRYRRLTYYCDLYQICSKIDKKHLSSEIEGGNKTTKTKRHTRTMFLFNDSIILTKCATSRLSTINNKQIHVQNTTTNKVLESKFNCQEIITFLRHSVDAAYTKEYQSFIRLIPNSNEIDERYEFELSSNDNCSTLLHKLLLAQFECRCIEALRFNQWKCKHGENQCMCLTIIGRRVPN